MVYIFQGTKVVCHLDKTMVDGGPDKCEYESSRERVDLPTLFSEHPHLAYDESTYSRVDQAPFYVKNVSSFYYFLKHLCVCLFIYLFS